MDEPENVTPIYWEIDDADIATPNCPQCLHPMEPRQFDVGVAWSCPECGFTLWNQ